MEKKFTHLSSLLLALVAMILAPLAVHAQEGDPIISFHTNMYAKATSTGATPTVTISLGATKKGTPVNIDWGYGTEENDVDVAVPATDGEGNMAISGTVLTGQVSQDGWVRIYGDPTAIDYFDVHGSEVDQVTFSDRLALTILNLEHNTLTSLNVDKLRNLQFLYLQDNPFSAATPLMIGRLPNLLVLEVTQIGHISPNFTLRNFPKLQSFDAYHTYGLTSCDPTQNPDLRRLSLDMTSVSSLNVSRNPELGVLNIADSRIGSIDLSNNTKIRELYASHNSGTVNTDVKLSKLDVRACINLQVLFAGGNSLTEIDLSRNTKLSTLSLERNKLRKLDLSKNTQLWSVNLRYNYFDFVTLPEPKNWFEYYHEQNPLELNETYKVTDVIDLTSRVVRPNSNTNAVLYRVPKENPTAPVVLDKSYYTYDNGKITLLKPIDNDDYAYVEFTNSLLKDYPIRTANFRVKTVADFGKDEKAVDITTAAGVGAAVNFALGVQGATQQAPVNVKVDFGDGNQVVTPITSEQPTAVNIRGTRKGNANVSIYVPQDKHITSLESDGMAISNIDLSKLTQLRVLTLKNAGLTQIDMSYNNRLQKLDLSGNKLVKVDLRGPSTFFYKSQLVDINVSNNKLDSLLFNDIIAVQKLDISNNNFNSLPLKDGDNLRSLNISQNKFTTVQLNHSELLEELNVSYNNIRNLQVPPTAPLKKLDIRGNYFTFANMPNNFGLGKGDFLYAPQQIIPISSASPGIDLSEQFITKNGQTTKYAWKTTTNKYLTEGTDYTINNGKSKFSNLSVGQIYCELTHPAYPDFTGPLALRTSLTRPIPMPTHVLATFTTAEKKDSVMLSLASPRVGTSVYFEWNNDGNVDQYTLKDTYTLFRAKSKANTPVRVLVAEPTDQLSVFSVSNVQMTTADLSPLTTASTITLSGAGLNNIKLPESSQALKELDLSGNKLKALDLSKFPNLAFVSLNSNELTRFDLSQAKNLEHVALADNGLEQITLDNPKLLDLALSRNRLTSISLEKLPKLQQLWLNSNLLTEVKAPIAQNPDLVVLNVVDNKLRFSTMPAANETKRVGLKGVPRFNRYSYNLQEEITPAVKDGKIDLSSEAVAGGQQTVFRWFIGGVQVVDGELQGEELNLDDEYTVENGVTTFIMKHRQENLTCVMTNPAFPAAVLATKFINFDPKKGIEFPTTGIENVQAEANADVKVQYADGQLRVLGAENNQVAVYTIDGRTVFNQVVRDAQVNISLPAGVYVVRVANKAIKVSLK